LEYNPTKPSENELDSYYSKVANGLGQSLVWVENVLGMTTNSDVIGSLAEGAVNYLVREIVFPARVSTGTVISPLISPGCTMQVDTIIWVPAPFPALYEFGHAAVVPYESVVGVLEVKRSNYSGFYP